MKEAGIMPSEKIYDILIEVYSNLGRVERAEELFNEMLKSGGT